MKKTEKPDRMLAHLAVEMDALIHTMNQLRASIDNLALMVELTLNKTAAAKKAAGR